MNIFERAKFGDRFVTRDGRIAIYSHYGNNFHKHWCLVLDGNLGELNPYTKSGDHSFQMKEFSDERLDIVKRLDYSWHKAEDSIPHTGVEVQVILDRETVYHGMCPNAYWQGGWKYMNDVTIEDASVHYWRYIEREVY